MLSPDASWFCLAAALLSLTACYFILRREHRKNRRLSAAAQQATEHLARQIGALESRLAEIEEIVHRQNAASPLRLSQSRSAGTLAAIESLADEAQLHSGNALDRARVAIQTGNAPVFIDPFANHGETIAIARLADQGMSAAEISRQLQKPLGEIELLLSLRPIRDAA